MSHFKTKKNYDCNMDIPLEIAKNPYDDFWIKNSSISTSSVYENYHNFLNKFFKKNNKNIKGSIIDLIQKEKTWLEIGFEIGKHPIDCIKTFYKQINKIKEVWTKKEDNLLLNLVKIYGLGNWKIISTFFEKKSNVQCLQRYKKIEGDVVKGKWGVLEDKLLKDAIEIYGNKRWSTIAQFVKNRNESQCRERWMRQLKKNKKKGKWDEKEDNKLKSLVDIHGEKWSIISEQMIFRNYHQCKRRWKRIKDKFTENIFL